MGCLLVIRFERHVLDSAEREKKSGVRGGGGECGVERRDMQREQALFMQSLCPVPEGEAGRDKAHFFYFLSLSPSLVRESLIPSGAREAARQGTMAGETPN